MLLAEAKQEGALNPGTIASMTGFGSGFTWASAAVRW
jgi:3-oxoacyl-[acyl-carrier-protein] synthase III